jgi:adenosylcobinamide-GDP ribazoletransferase
VKDLLVATTFLTRLPLPVVAGAADVGRAARWFPLVGAALGGAAALTAWGFQELLNVPPALNALLLTALGAWGTGAIHLDGPCRSG